jgi:hypothetical protein
MTNIYYTYRILWKWFYSCDTIDQLQLLNDIIDSFISSERFPKANQEQINRMRNRLKKVIQSRI